MITEQEIQQAMADNPDLPRAFVVNLLEATEALEEAEDLITIYRRRNSKTVTFNLDEVK